MRQIIIDKSIERGRLVYKFDRKLVGDYTMSFILGIGFPIVLFIWSLINPYVFRNAPGAGFLLCVITWTLINYYYSIKLVKVRMRNPGENKEQIIGIVQHYYPKVNFTSGMLSLIRGQKPEGWGGRGKVVSIIINGDYLYINVVSTFRGGQFDVLFCGLLNHLEAKDLARAF
ncbi:hypothetical protein [Mucilaginibacter psychrotolerans]|uniref:Uncharacterized protein n=1 Tax=Mucilaginibacter psychrotolerans TaxID=1524096 RepID=A0A4Y8S8R9_9SPHI|nr:hypothetical protein [Mucilaginibacter psychrotolerans]TFF35051.1 hypothetical protein E2R66_20115 [Mucilaginibacter psychrotolerans]